MPPSKTVPPGLLIALRDAGVDLGAAALDAGLDELQELETLSVDEASRLLDAAFGACDDATLALRVGACLKPELFGVVGLAAISAPTLGHAVARCARYKRLFSSLVIRVEEGAHSTEVHISHPMASRSEAARRQIDVEIAFLVEFGRNMASPSTAPLEVLMRTPTAAAAASVYAEILGCPVRMGQAHDAIRYAPDALDAPLIGANEEAHSLLILHAEQQLDALEDDIVARVRSTTGELLPEGPVGIEQVARRLAMSTRSLQRALSAEGTTFTSVVDETRRVHAEHYLRDARFDAQDVSYLVGFSHLNSFYRAFRRWTGMTPEAYRRQFVSEDD